MSQLTNLIEKFKKNPENAKLELNVESSWTEGLECCANMGRHKIIVDEPVAFGGKDSGPNPIMLILGALGTSLQITFKMQAEILGIKLNHLKINTYGNIDLSGCLGINESVRPGFQSIGFNVDIDSDASEKEVQNLIRCVDRCCPISDTLKNLVPVKYTLERHRKAG